MIDMKVLFSIALMLMFSLSLNAQSNQEVQRKALPVSERPVKVEAKKEKAVMNSGRANKVVKTDLNHRKNQKMIQATEQPSNQKKLDGRKED
tara:strand:- start:120 stop:395 length:276 start_codon:yes stop_codon:yes gene_type:complete